MARSHSPRSRSPPLYFACVPVQPHTRAHACREFALLALLRKHPLVRLRVLCGSISGAVSLTLTPSLFLGCILRHSKFERIAFQAPFNARCPVIPTCHDDPFFRDVHGVQCSGWAAHSDGGGCRAALGGSPFDWTEHGYSEASMRDIWEHCPRSCDRKPLLPCSRVDQ